jgi:hypothetical protein
VLSLGSAANGSSIGAENYSSGRARIYETGGLRRAHLRGHKNVPKRLLVHASAFNLAQRSPLNKSCDPFARGVTRSGTAL